MGALPMADVFIAWANVVEYDQESALKETSKAAAATVLFGLSSSKLMGNTQTGIWAGSIPNVTLNNGVQMPILGFGTNTLNGSLGIRCINEAISVGYRLIDTARIYGNEEAVGKGIVQNGIDRKEFRWSNVPESNCTSDD